MTAFEQTGGGGVGPVQPTQIVWNGVAAQPNGVTVGDLLLDTSIPGVVAHWNGTAWIDLLPPETPHRHRWAYTGGQ